MSYVRSAAHAAPNGAGWYEATPAKLKATLDKYFTKAEEHIDPKQHISCQKPLLGLIAPHAGMVYSGSTASVVYGAFRKYLYSSALKGTDVRRVFILGPTHVKGFEGVEATQASQFETPFGPLAVDTATTESVMKALNEKGIKAKYASQSVDEKEHSIELQTPYLSHALHFPLNDAAPAVERIKIVSLVIGFGDDRSEKTISSVLQPYMESGENFFIYSSDFCHWGDRFDYTYHYEKKQYPNIGDSIIAMDHQAMSLLSALDIKGWYSYLNSTDNTICGRRPISVGLHYWNTLKDSVGLEFLHYSQSNKCASVKDSSVSYASALIYRK